MKYSIITPVYNREDCIARCIESVIRQRDKGVDIEHIIVDDGSRDGSAYLAGKYAEQNVHIRPIRFRENRGTNAARNAAIQAATGDFCIILDSDDYFVDNAIAIIDETIRQRPGFRHYMFAADDTQVCYERMPLLRGKQQAVLTFEDFLTGSVDCDYIHVMDRKVLLQYPFEEALRTHEGVFFLRFYKEVKRMLFTNQVVTIRERSRADSVTREGFKTTKERVRRSARCNELRLAWFEQDFLTHARGKLQSIYNDYLDDLLRLSAYEQMRTLAKHAVEHGFTIKPHLMALCKIHGGGRTFCYENGISSLNMTF